MMALPPVAPKTGWRASLRLPRDHYVRLDSNDYSVHPAVIGRRIEVVAGLDRVRAWCGGQLVADHERAWSWHQVITDPRHKAAAAAMRRQRVGMLRPVGPEPEVEQRPGERLRSRCRRRRRPRDPGRAGERAPDGADGPAGAHCGPIRDPDKQAAA